MLWLTSDHHFGHDNIIKYHNRPFADAEEMGQRMLEIWNDTVDDGDDVWVVGDIAMGRRSDTLRYMKMAKGAKTLIPGNHDLCWEHRKNWDTYRYLYLDNGFARIVQAPMDLEIAGTVAQVHHFPYRRADKLATFDRVAPSDNGGWLIHGHVHSLWLQRQKMINVSVEPWDFAPVSADQIGALIQAGPREIAHHSEIAAAG